MEPVASAGALPRPTGSGGTDLATLLRQGRVLSAEALSSPGEGSLVLAIGRHTVPAETALRLDPGERFLVRVEESPAGIVLRVLAAPREGAEALLLALREAVGGERPIGELHGELVRALAAARPEELAPAARALTDALPRVAAGTEGGPGAGAGLRSLLAAIGLDHEAGLAAVLAGRAGRGEIERLRDDVKAMLLRTGAELSDGPARDAVGRLLASLEANQLLNLARAHAGEPLVLSFPFPDPSGGWATARLLVPPRSDGEEAESSARTEDGEWFRIALGVELSRLGPVRADLALGPGRLAVRLSVASETIARRIDAQLDELHARLAEGGREIALDVRVADADALAPAAPVDIHYLRERRLMDLRG